MLIDKAIKIINQQNIGIYDIEELSRILILLSEQQGEYGILAAEAEHNYELLKAELTIKGIKTGLPFNKSEVQALVIVEKKYGDYRINKEKSKKYASICRTIESHIKLSLHRNKLDKISANAAIQEDF